MRSAACGENTDPARGAEGASGLRNLILEAGMPTYEYRCRGCRHAFERFQRMSDAPVRLCPSCGERRVERLISAGGGIVFKGAGFYATDYRQPENGGREATGSETASQAGDAEAGTGMDGSRDGGENKVEGGAAASSETGDAGRGGEDGS